MTSLVAEVAASYPDRPALVVEERVVTYAELEELVDHAAACLHRAGVRATDRVPLVAETGVGAVAALLAIPRIGAAAALMNPRLTSGELATLFGACCAHTTESTATVAVASPTASGALAANGCAVLDTTTLDTAAADTVAADTAAADTAAADVANRDTAAVVLFTSGTTGTPKAVVLTHGMLGSRIAALAPKVAERPDVALMCVPLVHVGGMLGLLVAVARGSTTVVQARFDPGEWLALVERHRVTSAFVVPTMLHRILDHRRAADSDLSSLQTLAYGAAPAPVELIRRAMERFPGVALTNTFGQTETMGSITALGPGDHTPERLASVGRPLPGVEVRVVDPTDGRILPVGAVGELEVRGAGVVVPSDAGGSEGGERGGWLRTGDMVSADADGYLYPAGRLTDTINRGGEKFAPIEVEAELRALPGVVDVAVVGLPDPEMGQRVGAAVVSDGRVMTVEELRGALRGRIADFKLPERVLVVDELPYNDFGKVDRRVLRDLFPA